MGSIAASPSLTHTDSLARPRLRVYSFFRTCQVGSTGSFQNQRSVGAQGSAPGAIGWALAGLDVSPCTFDELHFPGEGAVRFRPHRLPAQVQIKTVGP
jgi:hypothetical protein